MTEHVKSRRFEVAVVGVTFEGRQGILSELHDAQERNAELAGCLKREPDNCFDHNAVAVEVNNMQVGYIPKALAARLAMRIDAGEIARVTGVRIIEGGNKDQVVYGVRIDVEMQAQREAV